MRGIVWALKRTACMYLDRLDCHRFLLLLFLVVWSSRCHALSWVKELEDEGPKNETCSGGLDDGECVGSEGRGTGPGSTRSLGLAAWREQMFGEEARSVAVPKSVKRCTFAEDVSRKRCLGLSRFRSSSKQQCRQVKGLSLLLMRVCGLA